MGFSKPIWVSRSSVAAAVVVAALLIKVNVMGVKCFNWGHKHVKIIRTNKIEQPDNSAVKKKTLKAIVKKDKKASRKRVVRRWFYLVHVFDFQFLFNHNWTSATGTVMVRTTRRFSSLLQSLGAKKLFMERLAHSSLPKWMWKAKEGSRVWRIFDFLNANKKQMSLVAFALI